MNGGPHRPLRPIRLERIGYSRADTWDGGPLAWFVAAAVCAMLLLYSLWRAL